MDPFELLKSMDMDLGDVDMKAMVEEAMNVRPSQSLPPSFPPSLPPSPATCTHLSAFLFLLPTVAGGSSHDGRPSPA